MPPDISSPPAAADPIRAALADPAVLARMAAAAGVYFHNRMAHRPATERAEQVKVAVNNAAVLALDRAGRYDPAAGDVVDWLAGFARNAARDIARTYHRRAGRAGPCPNLDELPSAGDRPPVDAEWVAALLARLSPLARDIVRSKHVDGQTHEEIGRRVGLSTAAVRTRLSRAMETLRAAAADGEVRP